MGELTRRQLLQISGAAGLTVVTPVRLSGPANATLAPREDRCIHSASGST
jgi:hypothetical protein